VSPHQSKRTKVSLFSFSLALNVRAPRAQDIFKFILAKEKISFGIRIKRPSFSYSSSTVLLNSLLKIELKLITKQAVRKARGEVVSCASYGYFFLQNFSCHLDTNSNTKKLQNNSIKTLSKHNTLLCTIQVLRLNQFCPDENQDLSRNL